MLGRHGVAAVLHVSETWDCCMLVRHGVAAVLHVSETWGCSRNRLYIVHGVGK